MELNDYQKRAMTTCLPSCGNFSYMMLNLVGEVGEFASKVAKAIRHKNVVLNYNQVMAGADGRMSDKEVEELRREAGDILWQLSGLCHVMGWSLEEVAQENLSKLADRKGRGVIDGSGDER